MKNFKINDTYYIKVVDAKTVETNIIDGDDRSYGVVDMESAYLRKLTDYFTKGKNEEMSIEEVRTNFNKMFGMLGIPRQGYEERYPKFAEIKRNADGSVVKVIDKKILKEAAEALFKWFSETSYKPSLRFANNLVFAEDKEAYVRNYFAIQNHPDFVRICELTEEKNAELNAVLELLAKAGVDKPTTRINKRFTIFYGDPGGGKTTTAMGMTDLIVVCNSRILPDDLLAVFDFDDGKPVFKHTALYDAMTTGKPILLDEINNLQRDTLDFLQGILDNKGYFEFKGTKIEIADGFKIIGTMNLHKDQTTVGITEALADRGDEIREFELTPELLINAWL